MKWFAVLILLLPLAPGIAFAHPQQPPGHHGPPLPCKSKPPADAGGDTSGHVAAACLAGTALGLNAHGMSVRPLHGHAQAVHFTSATVFQTDSGPGALEGLMNGDFVCIAGTQHGHTLTATVVLFDLRPFPCIPHHAPHPPKPH